MKPVKNILFVCKHNVFRSRVAEEYMRKVSKGKYSITSAGLIEGDSLPNVQRDCALEFDLDISFDSKTMSIEMLKEQDLVVVVASDVPKEVFDNPLYNLDGKLVFWDLDDVKDVYSPKEDNIKEIIKKIITKVDKLNEELERK